MTKTKAPPKITEEEIKDWFKERGDDDEWSFIFRSQSAIEDFAKRHNQLIDALISADLPSEDL